MTPAARQSRARQHWQAGRKAADAQQWPQALREFDRAAALTPGDAVIWLNLARAQLRSGQVDAATDSARRAYTLEPDNGACCHVLAECLALQHHHDEAAQVFAELRSEVPRDFDLWAAQGNALFQAGRPREAIDAFFHALALRVDSPLVHYRMGLAFTDLALAREASECFRTAAALDSGHVRALALSHLVHASRQACEWGELAADTAQLLQALDQAGDEIGERLSPFGLLAVDSSPAQQRRIGRLRCQNLIRGLTPLPPSPPRRAGRIRVGYLSADFSRHATAVLMAELLEQRDRERFEVFLYSHSVEDGSDIQQRVRAACEHYLDVTHLGNEAVARRMRDDGLDIVVDLKGHTRDSRFEILAWRPAPVQVAYLGYPATTGADFIDYLIGDPVVTPLSHAANYSEHIAQLPHSYQPNDRQRPLPPAPSRAAVGLPEDAVVLCCFNQTYKMSPAMLDLWARILHGAPQAVLWMLAWNGNAQARLLDELAQRGIDGRRLIFAPKQSLADHLARLRCADLFLDTWPCNAHTTASEALWAGVPVLTVPGATFASRVAASLVHACGLGDFACADAEAYVALATALCHEPDTLAGLKLHLASQRLQLPLFDSPRYARNFEALLQRMHDRAQAGLAPEALAA